MSPQAHQLDVFLEAIRHELEGLEALGRPSDTADTFDTVYHTLMDTYTLLRNRRAEVLQDMGWPQPRHIITGLPGQERS